VRRFRICDCRMSLSIDVAGICMLWLQVVAGAMARPWLGCGCSEVFPKVLAAYHDRLIVAPSAVSKDGVGPASILPQNLEEINLRYPNSQSHRPRLSHYSCRKEIQIAIKGIIFCKRKPTPPPRKLSSEAPNTV
jgi:hypothetical protein